MQPHLLIQCQAPQLLLHTIQVGQLRQRLLPDVAPLRNTNTGSRRWSSKTPGAVTCEAVKHKQLVEQAFVIIVPGRAESAIDMPACHRYTNPSKSQDLEVWNRVRLQVDACMSQPSASTTVPTSQERAASNRSGSISVSTTATVAPQLTSQMIKIACSYLIQRHCMVQPSLQRVDILCEF